MLAIFLFLFFYCFYTDISIACAFVTFSNKNYDYDNKDNRTAHLTERSDKSVAYVTNNKRLLDVFYCWSILLTDTKNRAASLRQQSYLF